MKIEIKLTSDNSHTLFVPELNETYHSRHGAIQEAKHVFIDAGLRFLNNEEKLNVLEVGFGTGLNALLSCVYATENKVNLKYTGVELNPVTIDIIKQLNYTDYIKGNAQKLFLELHNSKWEEASQISEYFNLNKVKLPILSVKGIANFDVVFYDAFGPNVQGEMWGKDVFEMLYKVIRPGGVLVTYCAKGVVKRTLKEVGFKLESLPGPPGKREMTRAVKL